MAAVLVIVTIAWFVGRNRPTPDWIEHGLVPALGWVALALVAVVIVDFVLKARRRRLQTDKENSKD
jgi:hypothetical protein